MPNTRLCHEQHMGYAHAGLKECPTCKKSLVAHKCTTEEHEEYRKEGRYNCPECWKPLRED